MRKVAKGFEALKGFVPAMPTVETPKAATHSDEVLAMRDFDRALVAHRMESVTPLKPREPRNIHQEVKSNSIPKPKLKSKRKEAGKGMYHSGVDPSLSTQNGHLYRFYGFTPKN